MLKGSAFLLHIFLYRKFHRISCISYTSENDVIMYVLLSFIIQTYLIVSVVYSPLLAHRSSGGFEKESSCSPLSPNFRPSLAILSLFRGPKYFISSLCDVNRYSLLADLITCTRNLGEQHREEKRKSLIRGVGISYFCIN